MHDNNKPSYEIHNAMNRPENNGSGKPDFGRQPFMRGAPDFGKRPHMYGRPDFDRRPPMHGAPGFDRQPPMYDGPDFDELPPMHDGPDFDRRPPIYDGPDFDGQPPMHGGPDFDERPPMHGGPDFNERPPMHGGPDFDRRPPMHGEPDFDRRPPMHSRPDFGGQPPMHGGPDFDERPPMHGGPDFDEQPPMPSGRSPFHGIPRDPMRNEPFPDLPGQYDAMSTEEKLMHNLRRLSHRIHISREGISGQKRILTILSAVPCISQRQLTELLGVRAGTLSEVIGKLEAAGKIRRMPNPTDRRTWMVSITEAGIESLKSQAPGTNENMFAPLSEEEKKTFLAILEKLLKESERMSQEDSDFHKI